MMLAKTTPATLTQPALYGDDPRLDERLDREDLFPCLFTADVINPAAWSARCGDLYAVRGWETYSTLN